MSIQTLIWQDKFIIKQPLNFKFENKQGPLLNIKRSYKINANKNLFYITLNYYNNKTIVLNQKISRNFHKNEEIFLQITSNFHKFRLLYF